MKSFQNYNKNRSGLLKIIAALTAVICLTACCINDTTYSARDESSSIIPYDSVVAWTKDEAIGLYWMYSEELDEVAGIVLASDDFRQSAIDGYDHVGIISNKEKIYFSEEDWGKIVDLFEKTRPIQIGRSWEEGEDVVFLGFTNRLAIDGGYWVTCTLYYIDNPKVAEKYRNDLYTENLEHLDGYWYINEFSTEGRNPMDHSKMLN